MGLLANGFRQTQTGQMFGSTLTDGTTPHVHEYRGHMAARMRNMFISEGITDQLASVPSGNRHPVAWVLAQKNGAMASRNIAGMTLTASGAGAMGVPITGSTSFSFTFDPADGQLISSGSGSASMNFAATGNVLATLSTTGSASMSFSTNTPLLGALGWVTATGAFSINGALTSYAKGFMVGTTVDSGTLTTAAIIAAMNATPPAVNVKKVNDVGVTGTGAPGDEWGP